MRGMRASHDSKATFKLQRRWEGRSVKTMRNNEKM
jgi:hypothetical protein